MEKNIQQKLQMADVYDVFKIYISNTLKNKYTK